jgi:hypothetical protein
MLIMAYNLMSLFRQVIMGNKIQPKLSTLRYELFATGGYMVKEGNSRILKLSLTMKRELGFWGLGTKCPGLYPFPSLHESLLRNLGSK